jgi:hypothetical protein
MASLAESILLLPDTLSSLETLGGNALYWPGWYSSGAPFLPYSNFVVSYIRTYFPQAQI